MRRIEDYNSARQMAERLRKFADETKCGDVRIVTEIAFRVANIVRAGKSAEPWDGEFVIAVEKEIRAAMAEMIERTAKRAEAAANQAALAAEPEARAILEASTKARKALA